jgi:hypothetical protein
MSLLRVLSLMTLLNLPIVSLASTINCRLHYASLEMTHLRCLKKTTIVSRIRKNFRTSETLMQNCPKCHATFPDEAKFQYLFHLPLLALEIDTNDFGGYWIFEIFKNQPKLYRLWLYEIDEGNFQLREIKVLEMSEALKANINKLSTDPAFATSWLN